MKIWIFHHYATLPNLNGHIRPYRFAKHLEKTGKETVVFAASYQHFAGYNLIKDKRRYLEENYNGVPFVFVKTADGASGVARIRNMFSFFLGLLHTAKTYAEKDGKPDIILASSPQPLAMVAGIIVARRFRIPCVCEIRDLWPEAIFSVSKKIKENGFVGRLLTKGEHWIYKNADALVFTKEGDTDSLKEKGWTVEQGGDISLSKCFYINNGIELNEYEEQKVENAFADADLDDDSFKLVYAGAIRPVNNVGNILDAAKLLPKDENIKILIYGDGNQKEQLENRVKQENIDNVIFKGFVEKKYLPYILSKSSANLLNYSSENYNWSRGVSSNKLFEYLASGKPVISTVKTGYSIIEKYQCGTEMEHQTPEELAKAVLAIKHLDSQRYNQYCNNALNAAKNFDYESLTNELEKVFKFVKCKDAK